MFLQTNLAVSHWMWSQWKQEEKSYCDASLGWCNGMSSPQEHLTGLEQGCEHVLGSAGVICLWCLKVRFFFFNHERKWKSLSHVRLFATLWTMQSMEFSRQEYKGVSSLSLLQGIFPTQGLNPGLLCGRQILFWLSYQGIPCYHFNLHFLILLSL